MILVFYAFLQLQKIHQLLVMCSVVHLDHLRTANDVGTNISKKRLYNLEHLKTTNDVRLLSFGTLQNNSVRYFTFIELSSHVSYMVSIFRKHSSTLTIIFKIVDIFF